MQFRITNATEHEVEKYKITAIMASEAGSKNMQVGDEKVICGLIRSPMSPIA